MKKLTLIIVIALGSLLSQAQTLKGITIGHKLSIILPVTVLGDYYMDTTVGGLYGRLFIATLKDGRVRQITFISNDPAYPKYFADFKIAIETNYKVIFKEDTFEIRGSEKSYKAQDGDIGFWILKRADMTVVFQIYDRTLSSERVNEKTNSAIDDF